MNKTPSLFARDFDAPGNPLIANVSPGAEWVINGEGVPTRKYDGTCVMLDEAGDWWARREVKKDKTPPPNFRPTETDDVTGKTMGWEPISQSGFSRHWEDAFARANGVFAVGTYELCGPKINGNPEGYEHHILVLHRGAEKLQESHPSKYRILNDLKLGLNDSERYGLVNFVVTALHREAGWEGIVWHHPDGRYVKIKARDFR